MKSYQFSDIESAVCGYYQIQPTGLYSRDRRMDRVLYRQIIAFLALEYLPLPATEIGKRMHRNHAMVIRARKVIAERISRNPIICGDVNAIRRTLDVSHNLRTGYAQNAHV